MKIFSKYRWGILLSLCIIAYIFYFSLLTILRMHTLYASYFDLGIMHQTVYNSFRAIATGDWSRFLELTNPHGFEQVKRMAIHNDILLGLLAPFYFIYSGAETLLVIQSVALAIGAVFVYKIALTIFKEQKYKYFISFLFAFAFLLNPSVERTNVFEFHAVTLATTFLLAMFYFWLIKKNWFSFIFFILAILTKEEVPLVTFMFGAYTLFIFVKQHKWKLPTVKQSIFPIGIMLLSIVWFILSVFVIIPFFRNGGGHFAIQRYSDFGESPSQVMFGVFTNPASVTKYVFSWDSMWYLIHLFGPLGFLSLLSPLELLIALPEFAINLLSNDASMRNIFFHYTAVIQPFIFISALYSVHTMTTTGFKLFRKSLNILFLCAYLFCFVILFSYLKSPLPYSREKEIYPFIYPQKEADEVKIWSQRLNDDNLKVSSTGHLAPFFTSRRYFYNFSKYYKLADYVVLNPLAKDQWYYEEEPLIPIYKQIQKDSNFKVIYKSSDLEVYKKVSK